MGCNPLDAQKASYYLTVSSQAGLRGFERRHCHLQEWLWHLTLLADGIKIIALFLQCSHFFLDTLNTLLNTQQHEIHYCKCSASCKGRAGSEYCCCVADKLTLLIGKADDTDKDSSEIKKSCQVAAFGGNTSEKCSSLLSGLFVVFS